MAPEVLAGKQYHGPQVDIWSLGVLLADMLAETTPFAGASEKEIRRKIHRSQYRLPDYVSCTAKDLVGRMLIVDPTLRISLPDIQKHLWLE